MKNKKMGILAVLVMLVAVTLNAVGGTYAKYISSYGTTDTARVAKWDFTNTPTKSVDLFQQSYTKDADNHTYVATSDMYKVIAPGTNGSYDYKITGTAETNFKVNTSTKIINKVWLDTASNVKYNPVEFTFDGGTTWVRLGVSTDDDGNVIGEWDASLNAYTYDKTVAGTDVYAANTVLSDANSNAITGSIGWRWVYDKYGDTYNANVDDTTPIVYSYSNDIYDTELGKQIDKNSPQFTVKAEIGVSVVQTDEVATVGAADIASTSINLSDAELKDVVENWGYDANNAKLSFDGKTLRGTAKAYSTDSVLFKKYDVSTANPYFGVVKITIPAGYELWNTSTYEGVDKKINLGATNSDTIILSFKSAQGVAKYELRKAGEPAIPFEIAYDLTLE